MDQKKIQRIIGIVVVIALVVVVMPLVLGKNDLPTETVTTNIKAPLPDQSTPVALTTPQDTISSETSPTTAMAAEPTTSSMNTPAAESNTAPNQATIAPTATPTLPTPPALAPEQIAASEPQKPAEATQAADKPAPAPGSIIYEPATTSAEQPTVTETDKPTPIADTVSTAAPDIASSQASAIKVKQAVMKEKKSRPKSITAIQAKTTTPSQPKLKSGWAVQMGNFATKKNATHLAKVLRAAGYKVFTQDIKTAQGKMHTRVYIGPELKQASATKLSHDIHRHLNMQGYVVSYKL